MKRTRKLGIAAIPASVRRRTAKEATKIDRDARTSNRLVLLKSLLVGCAAILSASIFTRDAWAQYSWPDTSQAFEGTWQGTTDKETIDRKASPSLNPINGVLLDPENATIYADKRQLLISTSENGYQVGSTQLQEQVSDPNVPSLSETAQIEEDNPNTALAAAFTPPLPVGTCSAVSQRLANPRLSQSFLRIHIEGSYSDGGHPVTYVDTMCCFLSGQQSMACYTAANYWLDRNWWYDGHWKLVMTRQPNPFEGNPPPESPIMQPIPSNSGF